MTVSIPRIRSISPTAKGLACPVFMKWLFERLDPPPTDWGNCRWVYSSASTPATDWLTNRFLEVK